MKEKNKPLDFLGNPIKVGDTVVWAEEGGRGGSMRLHKTKAYRLTSKQVLVAAASLSHIWRPFRAVVVVAKGGTEQ